MKQHFYKSFGIQYRLHLHFYLLWKEQIACALKTWRSLLSKKRRASHRAWHFNNTTLSQSELIRMFFISYDTHKPCFCSLRAKIPRIWLRFSRVFIKKRSSRRIVYIVTGDGEGTSFASSPLGGLEACSPRKFWIFKPSVMPFPDIWRYILFLTSCGKF